MQDTDQRISLLQQCSARYTQSTYIDHSIGSDAEKSGSLVDCLDLFSSIQRDFQAFKFAEGTLQGGSVLGDQVITGAEVIEFADKNLQGALDLATVRPGCGLLIPRVIWKKSIIRDKLCIY